MPLLGQPVRVGRVGQDGGGEMRSAHRLARRAARVDRGGVDLEPELTQAGGHRFRPALAVTAGVQQALGQQRAAVIDPVAEHVQVLVAAVDRRDLGGRHHPHAVQGARREGLVHAVDGVVVGEGEQLHPRPRGVLHHLGGGQLAVGVQRVGLEVEGGGAHAAPGYSTGIPWRIVFSVTTRGSANCTR